MIRVFLFYCALAASIFPVFSAESSLPKPMPVISRGVPAYASSGNASYANDNNYETKWRSSGDMPQWLAYDLSGVPEEQRAEAVLFWDCGNYNYIQTGDRYNCPGKYTIDVHPGTGGGTPPAVDDPGWVTLVTVDELNIYNSRQHEINLTNGTTVYNWIRIYVTEVNGTTYNWDVNINMDIYDTHLGNEDNWIYFGDSITAGAMTHSEKGDQNVSQIVNEELPQYFPIYENAGMGGWHTGNIVNYYADWVDMFPGKYVAVAFGTNDAGWNIHPDTYYDRYEEVVQYIINAGKIPVIPTIPWLRNSAAERVPPLNSKLEELKDNYPEILDGPDFWTFFETNQNMISSDNIHPTDEGFLIYRRMWAEKMLEVVYNVNIKDTLPHISHFNIDPDIIANDVEKQISISATVTSDTGSIVSVIADLTEIGGGAGVALTNSGDEYSTTFNVNPGLSTGKKTITLTAQNEFGYQRSVNSSLQITEAVDGQFSIYNDTESIIQVTWNSNGTVSQSATDAYEGSNQYQFVYDMGSDSYANFGLNFTNWAGTGSGYDFSGYLKFQLALRLTNSDNVSIRLKDSGGSTSDFVNILNVDNTYSLFDLQLDDFDNIDFTDVMEIIIDINGTTGSTGTLYIDDIKLLPIVTSEDQDENLPAENFNLSQNYPNPFNPSTMINYQLPMTCEVSLKVYDILGRDVTTLINEQKSAGNYSVKWNGTNSAGQKVGSGIYFYQLRTNTGIIITNRMMMLK